MLNNKGLMEKVPLSKWTLNRTDRLSTARHCCFNMNISCRSRRLKEKRLFFLKLIILFFSEILGGMPDKL